MPQLWPAVSIPPKANWNSFRHQPLSSYRFALFSPLFLFLFHRLANYYLKIFERTTNSPTFSYFSFSLFFVLYVSRFYQRVSVGIFIASLSLSLSLVAKIGISILFIYLISRGKIVGRNDRTDGRDLDESKTRDALCGIAQKSETKLISKSYSFQRERWLSRRYPPILPADLIKFLRVGNG